MAVKAERLLRVQLDQLPTGHPDRPFIQAQVDAFAAFNAARKDGASHEVPRPEIKRFSLDTREALEKEGYLIYELTGQSIESFEDQGRRLRSRWHKLEPELEGTPSRLSEVAINTAMLFIPESGKASSDRDGIFVEYSDEISQRFPGAQAVVGEVPDYIELAFSHLDRTGQHLFSKDNRPNFARTKTWVGGMMVGIVGPDEEDPNNGLLVMRFPEGADSCVVIFPLILPAVDAS